MLVCGAIVHWGLLCSQPQEFKKQLNNNCDKEEWKTANAASSLEPPEQAHAGSDSAVSVTMTITKTTLLVPLFVFKSPSL